MNTNQTQTPTIGEFMHRSKLAGGKALAVGLAVAFILIGMVYTGIHGWNLYGRGLPADQRIFALVPVILLEGSLLALLVSSFVWFSGGTQKIVGTIAGWLIFAVIGFNTVIDNQIVAGSAMPEWMRAYAAYGLFAVPVALMALWKLLVDLDPAKRKLDMAKAIEHSLDEAKYMAAQRSLNSEENRDALSAYGDAFGAQMAHHIRQSAPEGFRVASARPAPALPATQMAKDAPSADAGSVAIVAKDVIPPVIDPALMEAFAQFLASREQRPN